MQAVCTLLWIDCFETYMVVTYPLDLCYHEKRQDISVLTIWDLMGPENAYLCKRIRHQACQHFFIIQTYTAMCQMLPNVSAHRVGVEG